MWISGGFEANLSTLVLTLVHWGSWLHGSPPTLSVEMAPAIAASASSTVSNSAMALRNACRLVADTRLVLAAVRQRTSDALWQARGGGPPALHWQLRVGRRLTGHAPGGTTEYIYVFR